MWKAAKLFTGKLKVESLEKQFEALVTAHKALNTGIDAAQEGLNQQVEVLAGKVRDLDGLKTRLHTAFRE